MLATTQSSLMLSLVVLAASVQVAMARITFSYNACYAEPYVYRKPTSQRRYTVSAQLSTVMDCAVLCGSGNNMYLTQSTSTSTSVTCNCFSPNDSNWIYSVQRMDPRGNVDISYCRELMCNGSGACGGYANARFYWAIYSISNPNPSVPNALLSTAVANLVGGQPPGSGNPTPPPPPAPAPPPPAPVNPPPPPQPPVESFPPPSEPSKPPTQTSVSGGIILEPPSTTPQPTSGPLIPPVPRPTNPSGAPPPSNSDPSTPPSSDPSDIALTPPRAPPTEYANSTTTAIEGMQPSTRFMVIGGTVGGILLAIMAGAGMIYRQRRRHRQNSQMMMGLPRRGAGTVDENPLRRKITADKHAQALAVSNAIYADVEQARLAPSPMGTLQPPMNSVSRSISPGGYSVRSPTPDHVVISGRMNTVTTIGSSMSEGSLYNLYDTTRPPLSPVHDL
ncbi:hypothetical protein HDV05_008304 [Chytridiales sp. JEL 0842]|nr:hypothetical protein HDV05_008304 [Chytridiales sp. JEL 0842]